MNKTSHKTQFSTSFPHSKHIFLGPRPANNSKRHNVADTKNLESRDWNSKLRPRRHDKNFCPFQMLACLWFIFFYLPWRRRFLAFHTPTWTWRMFVGKQSDISRRQNSSGLCFWLIKMRGIGSVPSTKVKAQPEGQKCGCGCGCGEDILRVANRTWPDLTRPELSWTSVRHRHLWKAAKQILFNLDLAPPHVKSHSIQQRWHRERII